MNLANPYLARTKGLRLAFSLVALVISVGALLYLVAVYNTLPATVPTHFDLAGHVDGHGPKRSLWLTAGISLLLTIGLVVLQYLNPKYANYGVRITDKSRDVAYTIMPVFVCFCSIVVAAIFAITVAMSLNSAGGLAVLLWIPIALLVTVSVVQIWYLWWLEHRTAPR